MEGKRRRRDQVVIVGGGIAGALLAKTVQFKADVVLIDPKEYFEIPWANLRAKVTPSVAERSVVNHTDYFTNGKLIISSAADVTESEVLTSEGRVVAYDYLVIATGRILANPRSRRDKLEKFQEDNQKIKCSGSILIIGGGPVGVELAAEIASDYPEKKVTLVHSGTRLLEFMGPKASNKALEWLKSKKVEVLLEQSIDIESISEADRVFKTSSGEIVTADCHFVCVCPQLGSAWLHGSFLNEYLDRRGRLMVDENLRVGGLNNIFAIGDINDVPEMKRGFLAQQQALVVAKNLKRLMKGKENKLVKYKASSSTTMVSLGRKDALAENSLLTIIGQLPGKIRSRDLFVGKTRKLMGLDS